MKNIIFISYSFGGNIPVGVGSLRIAKAMIQHGYRIFVVTETDFHSEDCSIIVRRVTNTPRLPFRVSSYISNLLQKELFYYSWERKAKSEVKKLVRKYNIHAIYTRSTPICVCPVGIYAKERFRLPLIMHFTDPIPAPEGWVPDPKYRKRMIKQMGRYLSFADNVSFGNERMLAYQERVLSCHFGAKAFISPDPCAEGSVTVPFVERNPEQLTLVFLGNVYGNRNPAPLLASLNSFPIKQVHFVIYGNKFDNAPDFVEFRGRTNNIQDALRESDVLVDIDGDDETPVFISSKLKDYLSINRPILSISPLNSPSRDLLDGLKTVEIVKNNDQEISSALYKIVETNYKDEDFNERLEILKKFSAPIIAKEIATRIKVLCNKSINNQ